MQSRQGEQRVRFQNERVPLQATRAETWLTVYRAPASLAFLNKTVDLAKMSWLGFVVWIWGSFVLVGSSLSGFAVRDLNLRFRQRTAAQDTPRDFCCTFGFHSSAQGEA